MLLQLLRSTVSTLCGSRTPAVTERLNEAIERGRKAALVRDRTAGGGKLGGSVACGGMAAGMGHKQGLLRAAALSYVEGRSGDLIIAPKHGWMFFATGATHGTASEDDQRVPIILFGAGIKHGAFSTAATPADIAPTLAALCGITLPKAEGHPLQDALARTSTGSAEQ